MYTFYVRQKIGNVHLDNADHEVVEHTIEPHEAQSGAHTNNRQKKEPSYLYEKSKDKSRAECQAKASSKAH